MCGRYALYGPISRLSERFSASIDEMPADFGPRYNAAPMQMLPVVRQRPGGERVAHLLRWGLLPGWAKDPGIATRLINARAATLAEKPAFRAAYRARRCIVPASGFFEWQKQGSVKQPFNFRLKSGEYFAFAGLYTTYTHPTTGDEVKCYTIITTQPNDLLSSVHNRMPVILRREDEAAWLNPDTVEIEELTQFLKPYPADKMEGYMVDKRIGNPANDDPRLLTPTA